MVPTSTSGRPPIASVVAVPTLAERLGHPPDARLLMEELGAALHFFRAHAAQTN